MVGGSLCEGEGGATRGALPRLRGRGEQGYMTVHTLSIRWLCIFLTSASCRHQAPEFAFAF